MGEATNHSRDHMRDIGQKTQFNGENAASNAQKSARKRRARRDLKLTMRGVAIDAMFAKAPLPLNKRKQVANVLGIDDPDDVRVVHVAIFQQTLESMKGNLPALMFMRDMIGEKPTENVAVTAPDFSALDAAFDAMRAEQRAADEERDAHGETKPG